MSKCTKLSRLEHQFFEIFAREIWQQRIDPQHKHHVMNNLFRQLGIQTLAWQHQYIRRISRSQHCVSKNAPTLKAQYHTWYCRTEIFAREIWQQRIDPQHKHHVMNNLFRLLGIQTLAWQHQYIRRISRSQHCVSKNAPTLKAQYHTDWFWCHLAEVSKD